MREAVPVPAHRLRPPADAEPVAVEDSDAELISRLRAGDDAIFSQLVEEWSPAMLRLARSFVSSSQSAEDAVQDAWLGVLTGLPRFEGRSSLRTWTFAILVNRAKSRGVRESRTVAAPSAADDGGDQPTVDPARFQGPDGAYPGHWTSTGEPVAWQQPERRALGYEAITLVERALDNLPPRQRAVVTMRDVHGVSADEACAVLEISAENQRVLLHRGRAALRTALEAYYRG
jgi:RNA polymerase sigma-70 factor (ECF subfamily)